jgi:hypothetical protein
MVLSLEGGNTVVAHSCEFFQVTGMAELNGVYISYMMKYWFVNEAISISS